MIQTIWLSFPALTSALILCWVILKSDKRQILKSQKPTAALYFCLLSICLIEFTSYTQIVPASLLTLKLYYTFCLAGLTSIFCIAASLYEPPTNKGRRMLKLSTYLILLSCISLLGILLSTDLLISRIDRISYSITRIPGEFYFLIQWYLAAAALGTITLLASTAINSPNRVNSAKAKVLLAAITPLILAGIAIVMLMQVGFKINATIIYPIFITYFLLTIINAEKHETLFSMLMRIPFTKERKSVKDLSNKIQDYLIDSELSNVQSSTNKASLKTLTQTIENMIVEHTVSLTNGSQVQAAHLLGISASSITRKKSRN